MGSLLSRLCTKFRARLKTVPDTVTEPKPATSRLLAWRENFIFRKAKLTPSLENITQEMEEWMQNVVKCVLQPA